MRFDVGFTTSQSTFFLSATPDDIADGYPPVDRLLIDTIIHDVTPGNQVVAGVLAFSEYIGQQVTLNKEMPRMVEQGVAAFFEDRPVSASPVTDVPGRVWPSGGTVHLSQFDRFLSPPRTFAGNPHDYYVQVADGTIFNGSVASPHQMILASNASLISQLRSGTVARDALLIAIGVLLSRDLHIRCIRITTDRDRRELERYRLLLRSIDLNLSWASPSTVEATGEPRGITYSGG